MAAVVKRTAGRLWVAGLTLLLALVGVRVGEAAPRLGFSPARLTFDPGGESRVVTLRNLGDAPLQLKALGFSADSAGFAAAQLVPQVLAPGQELPVTVAYGRSGARPQAFGALLVYSDDPGGFDDPRSPERDWVRGVALVAGESTATLWLWLPPLVAAGLLLGWRRRGGGAGRVLQAAGVLVPLLASLWLLWHFAAGFTVPEGNYGIQLGLHRALWPAYGVELWTGLDGLSLPLVLLLAAAAALQLLAARPAGEPGRSAAGSLLLGGGALLGLCTLDAGFLLVGWELALLGALGQLGGWGGGPGRSGPRPRGVWRWFIGSQVGVLLMAGALGVVYAHSLPTALVDGTTAAHATDLVKLGYYNYFGDVALRGVPLARFLWVALTLGALLPVLLLPGVAVPLGERLRLSLPLLVLGVYGMVRLAFYVLPQAGVALGPWVVGAALSWGLGWTLRALVKRTLSQLLVAAVMARGGGILVGLFAATQAGVQAALLQLWHYALAVAFLALLLPHAGGAGRRPRYQACLAGAALLILDAPGMLGFIQRTLLVLGAFPGWRGAAVVMTLMSFLVPLAALRLFRQPDPSLPERPRAGSDLSAAEVTLGGVLGAGAVFLGLWPQPLLDLSRGFASDFITHVFAHLDASTIASRLL